MFEKYGLSGIQEFYEARNDKLRYDYQYWIQPVGSPYKSTLQIDVNVPLAQEIKYQPGLLEVLKFGWVQILALTVPCILIFHSLAGFLFRH